MSDEPAVGVLHSWLLQGDDPEMDKHLAVCRATAMLQVWVNAALPDKRGRMTRVPLFVTGDPDKDLDIFATRLEMELACLIDFASAAGVRVEVPPPTRVLMGSGACAILAERRP